LGVQEPVRGWYVVSFGSWKHGATQPNPEFTLFPTDIWPPLPTTLNHSGYSGRLHRWQWGGVGLAAHCGNGTVAEDCATAIPNGGNLLSLTSPPLAAPLAPALHVFAPECANGWTLLGELGKFSTLSAQRFASTTCTATGLSMVIKGSPDEHVEVTALSKGGKVVVSLVSVGPAGEATLVLP
jgi:hypothetical protein